MAGRGAARTRGQILPLFALTLVALITMAALLFDGAGALASRRRLQNAADAAALAGANVIQAAGTIRTCSATAGPPPGSPRADIAAAVQASIDANMPGFDASKIVVSCPSGWNNLAVRVSLSAKAPSFFAGALFGGPLGVGATATAYNGQAKAPIYSVVELDPWNAGWPNGRRGCPSLLLSGGPTVVFDGSVQVDSACPAAQGGAFATNGNGGSVTFNNGAKMYVVGGYSAGPMSISPAPVASSPYLADPLAWLDVPSMSGVTVRSGSKLTLNNASQLLQPGIYRGGIELKNSSVAYLLPGIYILDGGGLSVGAQASVFSIDSGRTSTTAATWASDCGNTTCGVLLFNTGTAGGSGAMDQITVGAGATVKLRAYDERANGNADPDYRNLLIFQDRSPAPSNGYAQPVIWLNGGGNVDISGTMYAPGALIHMGGSSGGSGGGNVDVTLQFVSWDLEIQGNAAFHFFYADSEFVRLTEYGLVE